MADIWEVKAPDGSTLEIQSNAQPSAADALRAVRAYGDSVAAKAQQRTQDTPILTWDNAKQDLKQAGSGLYGVLKTLGTAALTNPLGINQPNIRYDPAAHVNDPSLRDQASSALGTLRTLGGKAWNALTTDPRETLLEAGVTPDVAARGVGEGTAMGLTAALASRGGPPTLLKEGGSLLTRGAAAINPAVTEGIGALGGALLHDQPLAGAMAGAKVGKAIPGAMNTAGKLMTKAGQAMDFTTPAAPVVASPASNVPIPAQDLQAMLEELRQPEPAPSAQAPPTDVPPAGAGRTETGAVSSGRPAVTPKRYQEMLDLEKRAQAQAAARPAPVAAEPPPVVETEAPLPTQSVVPPPTPETPSDAAAAYRRGQQGPEGSAIRAQMEQALADIAQRAEAHRQATGDAGVTATEGVKPPPTTLDPEAQAVRDQTAKPTGVVQEAETAVPDYTASSGMNRLTPDHLDALGEDILSQMDTGEGRGGGRRAYALEDAAGAFLDHLKNQQGQFKGGLRAELETFLNSADVGKAARTRLREVVQSLDTPATTTPSSEGESTIPSREQMTPEELSRAREGARDSPDRQPGETVEDYRLRTAGRATGEKSAEPSIIPARRAGAIDDTIESMYERNATDQEFRDYLAKSKNHPKNGEIAAKIESKAHSYKRPSPLAHVIAGAAMTGAALRQALVGQLQGDQKEQD